eukprot:c27423_g1_i2 orf=1041-1742(-)
MAASSLGVVGFEAFVAGAAVDEQRNFKSSFLGSDDLDGLRSDGKSSVLAVGVSWKTLSNPRLRIGQARRSGPRAMAISPISAPQREKDPNKRVVITGMGLVSCFGNDIDCFYEKLLEGKSAVGPIDRFDASTYSTTFAAQIRSFSAEGYIDGKNDRRLDDSLRYCLVSGKRALEHADLLGDKLNKIDKQRVGVLVGSGMGGLSVFSDGVQSLVQKGRHRSSNRPCRFGWLYSM